MITSLGEAVSNSSLIQAIIRSIYFSCTEYFSFGQNGNQHNCSKISILRILVSVCLCVCVCVRNQVANWARRSPLIKKPILGKLFGAANNFGLVPSRPRRLFWGPLAAILDFAGGSMFLIEGILRSKNLFNKSCSEHPIT